jgi:hypothetical protein
LDNIFFPRLSLVSSFYMNFICGCCGIVSAEAKLFRRPDMPRPGLQANVVITRDLSNLYALEFYRKFWDLVQKLRVVDFELRLNFTMHYFRLH